MITMVMTIFIKLTGEAWGKQDKRKVEGKTDT
jgi:hypothetical protein